MPESKECAVNGLNFCLALEGTRDFLRSAERRLRQEQGNATDYLADLRLFTSSLGRHMDLLVECGINPKEQHLAKAQQEFHDRLRQLSPEDPNILRKATFLSDDLNDIQFAIATYQGS